MKTSPAFICAVFTALAVVASFLPAVAEPESGRCAALAPPKGVVIKASSVSQLRDAVKKCPAGGTILLANGTYDLVGANLMFRTPGVTLRSASGDREAVVLDGHYQGAELIQIFASDVTIVDLTLKRAYYHPVHVMSSPDSDTLHTRIYNVHIVDPGEQAIKINSTVSGHYTDDGLIACSHLELTQAGRPRIRHSCYTGGVDAHDSRGWLVRDNVIEGFWCPQGLSEHAIHFWRNSRDTTVERNTLLNNARGIGFGMMRSEKHRLYADTKEKGSADHLGGIIRNNFVCADEKGLFDSEYGFDCGISLWQSKGARVLHNTVFSGDPARSFASIEWRFPITDLTLANNLANIGMQQRDGARAVTSGNVTGAKSAWFLNPSYGDLHLSPLAVSEVRPVVTRPDARDDIDGTARIPGNLSYPGADSCAAGVGLPQR